MKLLHISDCHIGKKYDRYKEDKTVRDKVVRARLDAVERAVEIANQEKCGAMVIAGDIFDHFSVTKTMIKEVCHCLNQFEYGTVWVLPGNHDFYNLEHSGSRELWECFQEYSEDTIHVFKKNEPVLAQIDGEEVTFYPCICHDKHSAENALGWVREAQPDSARINIGVAHGSLDGLSLDQDGSYYSMSPEELNEIPMDVWLLGHAHVAFPELEYGQQINGKTIYNAGTPQQVSINNRTDGSVFLIEIGEDKKISAVKKKTGSVFFREHTITVSQKEDLLDAVRQDLEQLSDIENTLLRLSVTGTTNADGYRRRHEIEAMVAQKALFCDKAVDMDNLSEEITESMIDEKTVKGSIENQLLHRYFGKPEELELAMNLIMRCKEK